MKHEEYFQQPRKLNAIEQIEHLEHPEQIERPEHLNIEHAPLL